MTILLLVVMVVAAIILVRGQQNQPDLRGMNDHDRAMAALHKLAEPAALPMVASPRPDRDRAPSLWRTWRRPALAVVVLVAVGAVLTARLIDTDDHPVVHTATHAATPSPTMAARAAAAPGPAQAPANAAAPSGAAPPATAIQPVAEQTTTLAPTAADARSATYTVTTTPFSLVLTAGGPCWAEVRDAGHAVVYQGTMTPGEVETFTGTDLSLRLGAISNVTIQVNGAALVVPVKDPTPYNVRVMPAQ